MRYPRRVGIAVVPSPVRGRPPIIHAGKGQRRANLLTAMDIAPPLALSPGLSLARHNSPSKSRVLSIDLTIVLGICRDAFPFLHV